MPVTPENEAALAAAVARVAELEERRRTTVYGTFEQMPAEMAEAEAAVIAAQTELDS